MTRAEFLEFGNYIACLSTRLTIYYGDRPKIENNMFKYIYWMGNKCFIKSMKDSSDIVRGFNTLQDVKEYIRAYPVEGMKRI